MDQNKKADLYMDAISLTQPKLRDLQI